ncbi:serine/threonine-protein kinase [Yinghuangia soli]|uniref:Serine/threonine protein kinase n=1 Tax=Yinghuangia soli TaxID=2908204 RepID=A0AA41PYF3_9ACTN|nr:serine/threonine-protein kinase [Yinghuangia soli]MCF2527124.1 serine/threonine protein kinase [Yinghuangia soli]
MSAWAPLKPGDPAAVGPFQVLARLGSGGMGRVFLARSATGRWVAVKTIRPEFAAVGEFRRRFAHEAQAAARVSGVFTASIIDSDPGSHVPWIATAYVPAPSLKLLLTSCGPQPARTVMWLGAGIAEALESIHAVGVVHRDLKPSNILLDENGPRVIDFGVVHAEGTYVSTGGTSAIGTPGFMSPEQAYGTMPVTAATDIYALGLTLVRLITGESDAPVQHSAEGLPEPLRGIVERCLDRDARLRPSPGELIRLLAAEVDLVAHDNAQGWLDECSWKLIRTFRDAPLPATPEERTQTVPPPPRMPPGAAPVPGPKPDMPPPAPSAMHPAVRSAPAAPEPRSRRYAAARAFVPPQTEADHAAMAVYDDACRFIHEGRYHEAARAFHVGFQGGVQVHGPWHAYTVFSLLGNIHAIGRLGWATSARDQAATALQNAYQSLGTDHPFTLLLRGELAHWTGHAGDPARAADDLAGLAADYVRASGQTAAVTLTVRAEWATWIAKAGDPVRALRHFEALVGECRTALGESATVTLDAKNALAHWTGATGDVARARHLYDLLAAEALARYGAESSYVAGIRSRLDAWTVPG